MSDTPETDEQINGKPCTRFAIMSGDSLRDALVPAEHARKLERERDEARRLAEKFRNLSCEDQDEADATILPWEIAATFLSENASVEARQK